MKELIVIVLCSITAFLCAGLLLRAYFQTKLPLFLWSGLYFLILTINTLLLIADERVFTATDFRTLRLMIPLTGMFFLIYGLIFESEEED